jgi:hypothetical protein
MKTLSRRRAIKLTSVFSSKARSLGSVRTKAQPKPAAGTTVFEMASFTGARLDPDAAFPKALATISESAAEASKAGKPGHIVLNLDKRVTCQIKPSLLF